MMSELTCDCPLELDTLKIQSVYDDVDYLNSISRRRGTNRA